MKTENGESQIFPILSIDDTAMAFPSIPALSSSSASSPSTGPSGNSSSTTSLVLTAIVSGAVSAGITYWIQTRKRKKRIQRIKTEINEGIKKSASSSSIQSFTTPGNYSTATSERNLLEESFVNAQSNPIPLLRSMTDSTSSSSSSSSSAASTMAPSEELTREQLARNYSFLGEEVRQGIARKLDQKQRMLCQGSCRFCSNECY